MLVVVPQLRGRYRQLLEARLDAVERLVAEAQFVRGIEVVIVVEDKLDHIGVGVLAGDDALVEVVRAAPWAASFTLARPWVPLLIVDRTAGGAVILARHAPASGGPPGAVCGPSRLQ